MILRSFYARLSLLFLLLILMLGISSLMIAFRASGHLLNEVEQLLNREYAASIASELEPLIAESFSEDNIKDAIHYMMVLNPMVEIYLLDETGRILSYFAGSPDKVLHEKINLEPLQKFAQSNGYEIVLGEDPRTEDSLKPFSAARLKIGSNEGWVYVILRGQSYERSLAMSRSNYYIKSGLSTFAIAVIITAVLGLTLFFLLTQRLRKLGEGARAFKTGNFEYRVEIKGNDELASLGRVFNEMAESVKKGMQQLQNSEKQRREMIANISHDLRSPLTSIRGHLETIMLKQDDLSSAEQKEFLRISLKNVAGFQKLVEELFDLARLEARQTELNEDWFNLAELVQDIILKLKPQSDNAAVDIEYSRAEELATVIGDIGLIERAVTNVIENAISHTPENGKVIISVTQTEKHQNLTVSDTGAGIAAEDIPHVFERFYRADKSRNRDRRGTGLGLAIAKEVIDLHHGTITASNSDTGAVFTISLPL